MFNSMVLTADAFNVLSDFLGVVIALICLKMAANGPSERNTFGWTRSEVLGALINSVFMVSLCVTIFLDSLQLFVSPEKVDKPEIVLIVGAVGLGVNLVGMFVLNEYRSAPKVEVHHDLPCISVDEGNLESVSSVPEKKSNKKGASSHMNMNGAYLHVLGDALGSVVVIICAAIDWQVHNDFLNKYLDPILSIGVAIMLTWSSISLLKESSLTLLQAVPTQVNLMNLKANIMQKSHHIVEINSLHLWQLSSEQLVASVRIRFDDALAWEKMMSLISQIENCFYDEGIHVATVHPEVISVRLDSTDGHSIIDGIPYEEARARCNTCSKVGDDDSGINGVVVSPNSRLRVSIHGPAIKPNEDVTVWF